MRLFHFHHNSAKFHSVIHSDFFNFEISIWLQTIARSLISLFIPILLLGFGYELKHVLIYFLVLHTVDVPLNFLARKLVLKYGARAIVISATVVGIIYFFIFNNLFGPGLAVLAILGVLDALYDTLYWVAHMYLFVESSDPNSDIGRNTGIMYTVRSFAGKLGPAIGASILLWGGKTILITATIIFFILSIFPLLKLKHVRNKPPADTLSFKEFFSDFRERKDYLSLMFYSIHSTMEGVLWPLFIFSVVGTFDSIGTIALVISVSSIVFSYITGTLTKRNQFTLIIGGSICIVMLWLTRMIFPSEIVYYATTFIMAFFAILVSVPIESNIIERARTKGTLSAVTIRNAISMLPQVFIFAILLLVVAVFKVSFIIAIGSLLALLVLTNMYLSFTKRSSIPLGNS